MKKWYEVLHDFFNTFGISAYPVGGVPDEAVFPWMTYERRFGDSVETVVHLYFYTTSEAIPNEKAEEICERCRNGGVQLLYDGGTMWVKTSSPEWFSVDGDTELEGSNRDIKHRIINLAIDFITR